MDSSSSAAGSVDHWGTPHCSAKALAPASLWLTTVRMGMPTARRAMACVCAMPPAPQMAA